MSDFLLFLIAFGFVITALGTTGLYVADKQRNRKLDRMLEAAEEVMKGIDKDTSYYADLQKFIFDASQREPSRKSTDDKQKPA